MLSAREINGMYAIIASPATPDADRFDAVHTVDESATERLINDLIRDGADGLIVLGTTGECATLSDPDYRTFVSCVLETVGRRIPTFVGATALGGHEIARRLAFARDLGADGTLLGLPMWQPVTTSMAVRFYADVAAAFPDMAIMVYANARAFRYNFPTEFWTAICREVPTATSAKYSRTAGLKELVAATGGKINFVPNEMTVHEFHKISPETTTACWATASGMNPLPAVELMKAIARRDQPAIDRMAAAIAWANEPILPMVGNPELFAQYNIQMEKMRINSARYSHCGPTRPPYQEFPEQYAVAARECGQRWARICESYIGNHSFRERPWELPADDLTWAAPAAR